jgi:amidase
MNFTFDHRLEPALYVELGESFAIETEDAPGGYLKDASDLLTPEHSPLRRRVPPLSNPTGGPVYVRGVERGDVLVVNVEKIEPAPQGVTYFGGSIGPLAQWTRWPELNELQTHIIQHRPGPSGTTRDGKAIVNHRLRWPLQPMIGTIGVAPDVEVLTTSMGQGPWGGNLDCQDIQEGAKVYLPCFHPGGLLFIGDVHGSQGNTEFYSNADETRAEVVVSCQVLKNRTIPFPRVETADSIIALCCDIPLEEAVRGAIIYMMEWLIEEYGLTPQEAYMLPSLHPEFRINIYQMVKSYSLRYTVGAQIPKKVLEGLEQVED